MTMYTASELIGCTFILAEKSVISVEVTNRIGILALDKCAAKT